MAKAVTHAYDVTVQIVLQIPEYERVVDRSVIARYFAELADDPDGLANLALVYEWLRLPECDEEIDLDGEGD